MDWLIDFKESCQPQCKETVITSPTLSQLYKLSGQPLGKDVTGLLFDTAKPDDPLSMQNVGVGESIGRKHPETLLEGKNW